MDRIEKSIELTAPVSRVWRALTDHEEFGAWFRAKLEGPFREGQTTAGRVLYPGFEHLRWTADVKAIRPETYFAFEWHPYAIEAGRDYSAEPPTLVEFTLEAIPGGSRLRVVESGFDKLPESRRLEAFRMNERGWNAQMENFKAYVD